MTHGYTHLKEGRFTGIRRMRSLARLFSRKASAKLSKSKQALDTLRTIRTLKAEVELLTSYSTDVIYRLRYDTMQYAYISPSVSRLLGYTSEEMQQINIRHLIEETRIVTDAMRTVESFDGLESSRKKGEVDKWQADYLIKTKSGNSIWVSDISYPWFDEETGAMIGSVGSLRDITDRVSADNQVKEELRRIANMDSLTGLANRRVFFERLEEEIKRTKRTRGECCILLLDVNHFKKVNDSYGHDAGDQVLQELATIICQSLREVDIPARLGGEEFGILLPDTGAQGGQQLAERVRSAIAKHRFILDNPQHLPIGCTISIGIAAMRFDEEMTATRLYKMADTQLYIAKKSGRNQVCASLQSTLLRTPVSVH